MNNDWLQQRKENMLGTVIRDYSKSCVFMDNIYTKYTENDEIYDDLKYFVDDRTGLLWKVKENSHFLFKNGDSEYFENKFDKKISKAFHQLRIVKEEIYELKNYIDEITTEEENKIMENISSGIKKSNNKIIESKEFFKDILKKNMDKSIVLRIALTEDCLKNIYGSEDIIDEIYTRRDDAYIELALNFYDSGFFGMAADAIGRAMSYRAEKGLENSKEIEKLYRIAKKKDEKMKKAYKIS